MSSVVQTSAAHSVHLGTTTVICYIQKVKYKTWGLTIREQEIPVPQRWVRGAMTRDEKSLSPFILKSNRQKGGLEKELVSALYV